MITHDMLYALLQGLPTKYLDHLPEPWPAMARRISQVLRSGSDYRAALRAAFQEAPPEELEALKKAFIIAWGVVHIPRLTYRQREVLIALRTVQVASLAQISAIVSQERRNTLRRLEVLANKGLLKKIMQPNGMHYFAVQGHPDDELTRAVGFFLDYACTQLGVTRVFLDDLYTGRKPTQFTQPTQLAVLTRSTQPTRATNEEDELSPVLQLADF